MATRARASSGSEGTLSSVGYGLAVALIIVPLLEPLFTVWPLQPSNVQWRVGAFGMTTSSMLLPVAGVAVAALTAYVRREWRALQVVAVLSLAGALVLLGGLGLFGLDSLQVRQQLPTNTVSTFERTMVRAAGTTLLFVGLLAWIGIGGWKAAGGRQTGTARTSRSDADQKASPMLIAASDEDAPSDPSDRPRSTMEHVSG